MTLESEAQNVPPTGGLTAFIRTTQQKSTCDQPKRPLLKGINRTAKKVLLFRPNCKKWDCEYCSQNNARRWVFVAAHGAALMLSSGLELEFLTVTSHEKLSPEKALKVLTKAWAKLSTRMRRFEPVFEYFCITERQKNGKVHLHLIATCRITKKWLKDNARECGFGYQCDAGHVKSIARVSQYTTKYLAKALTDTSWPIGFRRVRTSRGWPDLPDLPKGVDWEFQKLPGAAQLDLEISRAIRAGYEVIIADGTSAWEVVNGKSSS